MRIRNPLANNAGHSRRLQATIAPAEQSHANWVEIIRAEHSANCGELAGNALAGMFATVSTSFDGERDDDAASVVDVVGRIKYGQGGCAMSIVEFDWLHGVQFSVPANTISIEARMISEEPAEGSDLSARLSANVSWGHTRPSLGRHALRRSFELSIDEGAFSTLMRVPNKADAVWLTRTVDPTLDLSLFAIRMWPDSIRSRSVQANPALTDGQSIPIAGRSRYWDVLSAAAQTERVTAIFGLSL